MAVSKRLRYEVMRRDNHSCRYCGASAPETKLTVDHVVPRTLGGTDDPENLVTACGPCNSGKSSVPADAGTVADVSADALRWAQAIKAAAEIYLDYTRQQRDNIRGAFQVAWDGWTYEYNGERHSFTLPTSWPLTIDALVRSGLRKDDLIDGINECMYRDRVNDRFKYFCGIAWHMVRDLHDGAHEYISVSDAWDEATAGERERDGETDGAT